MPKYDWRNECLQGVAFVDKSTIFPQAIAMAATWNPELIYNVASAIADEARARHHEFMRRNKIMRWTGLTFSTPNINIFRDPRWGRGQETFGEDPYLTSRMGVAFCKGLQGNHPKYLKVCAEPKHFIVHSGPEKLRHEINNKVSKKDLYETYLPAFKACIEEGNAAGIMCAYNRLNDEACCASKKILIDLLRKELKFKGYVIADGGAVWDVYKHHKLVKDYSSAAALALKNGCDVLNPFNIMTSAKLKKYKKSVLEGVRNGTITEEMMNNALRRSLIARFKLGMFDPPERVPFTRTPYKIIDCKKHRALALECARECIVLLKNESYILPINKNFKKIAVIGPIANESKALYYFHYYPFPPKMITFLEGMKNNAPKGTKLLYSKGCDLMQENCNFSEARAIAENSDIIVLFLGITAELEGEEGYAVGPLRGDRRDLNLPNVQESLLKEMVSLDKPMVLVLTSGSALSINYAKKHVPIILQAWYPGEEGGNALAEILFGKYNPSGRLPITFYKSVNQLPPFEDYGMENRTYRYFKGEPLFHFGHGMSYSTFEYSNLKLSSYRITKNEEITVSFDVVNLGNFSGKEVIQLYMKKKKSSFRIPLIELKRFKKISLKEKQKEKVTFKLKYEDFLIISDDGRKILEPGEFSIFIGGNMPHEKGLDKFLTSNIDVY